MSPSKVTVPQLTVLFPEAKKQGTIPQVHEGQYVDITIYIKSTANAGRANLTDPLRTCCRVAVQGHRNDLIYLIIHQHMCYEC